MGIEPTTRRFHSHTSYRCATTGLIHRLINNKSPSFVYFNSHKSHSFSYTKSHSFLFIYSNSHRSHTVLFIPTRTEVTQFYSFQLAQKSHSFIYSNSHRSHTVLFIPTHTGVTQFYLLF